MKKLIMIMVCTFWLVFIFFNSSQTGSISHTRSIRFVRSFFGNLFGNFNTSQLDMIIRKCAHGFEFMILAVLLFFLFSSIKVNRINVIIYSLFIVILIAVFDETLQLFIKDRTSKVTDVLIDFLGGIIGIIFAEIIYSMFRFIKNKKK